MIEKILEVTSSEVAKRKQQRPLDYLMKHLAKSDRSFAEALQKKRNSVILECKKASPSQGLLRENFNVTEIISTYSQFADAISVITNRSFFQGDLLNLGKARVVTQKPLLCKDFILTPYQIVEARYFDADAVLLMMSLLNDEEYKSCSEIAVSLNMDVLTEVHDEIELQRALNLGAKIIGVNNRDFRTLKVDLRTAERLLPKIPSDTIRVFESGISTHQELIQYQNLANAFLIGSSLMKREDLDAGVRELVFGKVKVCGLTRHEDAVCAYKSGALFGGIIFADESPRCVTLECARKIIDGCKLKFVGVFVNQPISLISSYVGELGLFAVQLHGEEELSYIEDLKRAIPGCEIWKAVRVVKEVPLPSKYSCDRIVLDNFEKDRRGGTGQRFDWKMLEGLKDKDSYILSGGLSPKNAREAQGYGLFALDVNSGVETHKGIKDLELLQRFFEELR